jgi:hypothetical protein
LPSPVEFGSDLITCKDVYHLMFDNAVIITTPDYRQIDES